MVFVWDIKFNSAKSQCIRFGECYSPGFTVLLGDLTLNWVNKLKYLGCYFNQSCTVDFNAGLHKYVRTWTQHK